MDGNQAAAYVSYAFTEVAGIFPITPSSPMAELVDEWSANGKKNIFKQPVQIIEMQSEGGASGTLHGSLQAGALSTTYTAAQGLLLMIPNMYKIAGEMLPGVFHVSARTLSAHALSIFGDHSDVIACRNTGFALLASSSPQEAMDLGAVAHLTAIHARMPFLHFFDGFRTSHEMQIVDTLDYDDLSKLIDYDALKAFRENALNPEHPVTRGTTVSPDIFFQTREASSEKFDLLPDAVEKYMEEINKLTGREYHLFDYYGAEDAERIVILMGSAAKTAEEIVDYLLAKGEKVGLLNVHLYRPFSVKHFLASIPKTVKKIACLDRLKETNGLGEPLYQDVSTVYRQQGKDMVIVGGRYGLSTKDTTPGQILAVFENLKAEQPKDNFTIGIEDDVTFTSLPTIEVNTSPAAEKSVKIWGMGSDGTVGANKNTIKILGDTTDLEVQAYFVYDSKKSGGLTQSHLRFSPEPIRSPYLINAANLVACHTQSYVYKYDMVKDLKENGIFLLNCNWSDEELEQNLPNKMKKELALKKARFYTIDAVAIAKKMGLGNRINTILQASFFKLTEIIPLDDAISEMKNAIAKTYFKKGQKIIDLNNASIDYGISELHEVKIPDAWKEVVEQVVEEDVPDFIKEVVMPMNRQEGNDLPVSLFKKYGLEDGTWYAGTTKYEKRGAAADVPKWDVDKCIQCNQCSFVCPHAAIRPFLLDDDEKAQAPKNMITKKAIGPGLESYEYRIQVSPYDCTGCGVCYNTCPVKEKALEMQPLDSQITEAENWNFMVDEVTIKKEAAKEITVKTSQFKQPLFEFSGACAGCGETPYIKLVTQLFGDHMFIGNASGCSSAYGGSTPATPYTTNKEGQGPAWAMSLFEDNAEYVLGFRLGHEAVRTQIKGYVEELKAAGVAVTECEAYLENFENSARTVAVSKDLLAALEKNKQDLEGIKFIKENKDYLTKKSFWAFGGDGWAYDIGYGGLDHVIASGENVNILVLDTEVYSNTGGQQSKATNTAAIAKFVAGGKETKKKDLGQMAMTYGYVYVAQIAMGYDQAQTLKAIREAEAYPGPSIVIAYSPCIEHGIKKSMSQSQVEMKEAVEAGYWHLYRYNPQLKAEGKNPFILDSREPTHSLEEFLRGENRYAALELAFPEKVARLYAKAEEDAKDRLERYKELASQK